MSTYIVLEKRPDGSTICFCVETKQVETFGKCIIIEQEVGETFEIYDVDDEEYSDLYEEDLESSKINN